MNSERPQRIHSERNGFTVIFAFPLQSWLRIGNEFNTVLAILRGGQTLEVYVNGHAICPPITLSETLPSVVPGIGLRERYGAPELKARAEFSSFKVWKLAGQCSSFSFRLVPCER